MGVWPGRSSSESTGRRSPRPRSAGRPRRRRSAPHRSRSCTPGASCPSRRPRTRASCRWRGRTTSSSSTSRARQPRTRQRRRSRRCSAPTTGPPCRSSREGRPRRCRRRQGRRPRRGREPRARKSRRGAARLDVGEGRGLRAVPGRGRARAARAVARLAGVERTSGNCPLREARQAGDSCGGRRERARTGRARARRVRGAPRRGLVPARRPSGRRHARRAGDPGPRALAARGADARGAREGAPQRDPGRNGGRELTISRRVVTVDLAARFVAGRDEESLTARAGQLVRTLRSAPGVVGVRIRVEGGVPVGLFPGYDLRRTVRAPLADRIAPEPARDAAAPRRPRLHGGERRHRPSRRRDLRRGARLREVARPAARRRARRRRREALQRATRPEPVRHEPGRRVELLLDRQVALAIQDDKVVRVFHVSSGAGGRTPVGSFRVYRKERLSWSVPFKVWMPWASYFTGGIAFHEYGYVPAYAASHGCVRMMARDAPLMYAFATSGTPVDVIPRTYEQAAAASHAEPARVRRHRGLRARGGAARRAGRGPSPPASPPRRPRPRASSSALGLRDPAIGRRRPRRRSRPRTRLRGGAREAPRTAPRRCPSSASSSCVPPDGSCRLLPASGSLRSRGSRPRAPLVRRGTSAAPT